MLKINAQHMVLAAQLAIKSKKKLAFPGRGYLSLHMSAAAVQFSLITGFQRETTNIMSMDFSAM
jgi:hypothetical protein